jgi:hypothetical protein
MEDVDIFYGHFVYFMVKGYILLPFGTFCGHLVDFFRFGILYREKSGNPAVHTSSLENEEAVTLRLVLTNAVPFVASLGSKPHCKMPFFSPKFEEDTFQKVAEMLWRHG